MKLKVKPLENAWYIIDRIHPLILDGGLGLWLVKEGDGECDVTSNLILKSHFLTFIFTPFSTLELSFTWLETILVHIHMFSVHIFYPHELKSSNIKQQRILIQKSISRMQVKKDLLCSISLLFLLGILPINGYVHIKLRGGRKYSCFLICLELPKYSQNQLHLFQPRENFHTWV